MQRKCKWWHAAVAALCMLPVVSIVPGCGGGGGSHEVSDVNVYAGSYNGTYTGTESGSLVYTIDNLGNITGQVTSPSLGTTRAEGGVNNQGNFSFSGTSANGQISYTFSGLLRRVGSLWQASGTWLTSKQAGGSFTAKQQVAGTPTPGPTAVPTRTPLPTVFNGNYSGTYKFPNSTRTGTLTLKINGNSATGRATETGGQAGNFTGTFDTSTHTVNMTGNFGSGTNLTPYAITGTLMQNADNTVTGTGSVIAPNATATWNVTKTS